MKKALMIVVTVVILLGLFGWVLLSWFSAAIHLSYTKERVVVFEKGISSLSSMFAQHASTRTLVLQSVPVNEIRRKCSTEKRFHEPIAKEELELSFHFFCFQFDERENLVQIDFFSRKVWERVHEKLEANSALEPTK